MHRDLKPANIWVTGDDVVKLMDFGLAKRRLTPEVGITVSGFMAGTPGYMPPEQISSFASVTAAADVYALGVTAYEMLTGRRPFRHRDPSQIFRLQFTTEAAPPSSLVPDVSPALDAIILQALDREPAQRPSIDALAEVFRAEGSRHP